MRTAVAEKTRAQRRTAVMAVKETTEAYARVLRLILSDRLPVQLDNLLSEVQRSCSEMIGLAWAALVDSVPINCSEDGNA